MGKLINKLLTAKKLCNEAKIGDDIICPSCGETHTKKSYQSVFCKTKGGTKCKDYFWNNVDDNKRNNKTRISPASARYMSEQAEKREDDLEDDGSWDAHQCHIEPCEFCGKRNCECDEYHFDGEM